MAEETSSSATGMDSSDVTAKPTKGGPSRGLVIGGLLAIVVIAGVILVSTNSDAPRGWCALKSLHLLGRTFVQRLPQRICAAPWKRPPPQLQGTQRPTQRPEHGACPRRLN
jgi:hypothetical protein